jgi:phosphoadenosine phosphosulfate reductase
MLLRTADAPGGQVVNLPAEALDPERHSAGEILSWAERRFGSGLVFVTGLGLEGCTLLDLIARHAPSIEVLTIDTGLLFPETLELRRRLEERYGLTIRRVKPVLTVREQAAKHGEALWHRDPDACCRMRKVEPLREALNGRTAWISSIRRDQTTTRATARVVEDDPVFDLAKVNPLLAWTRDDVWKHVREHDIPHNPLLERGYPTIGCFPCTSPINDGESIRAGRWRGREKTECGLHQRPATKTTGRVQ